MEWIFAPLIFFFWMLGGVLGLALTVFWIWMIVDCAQNETSRGNSKIVWLLIIILLNWVGAILYYFIRRSGR